MSYTDKKWWDAKTVAVVTGCNRGIGKEIARLLAQQGLTVIATTRSEESGQATTQELSKAAAEGGSVAWHQLEVSDPASVAAFKDWMAKTYGSINILVNNAGFAYKGDVFGPQELRHTLATNYYGTANLTEHLVPLMQQGGRVVTVSSRAGLTSILKSQQLKQRFLSASTKAELDQLVDEFLQAVDKGDDRALAQAGWPRSMYGVSKLAITQYCRVLAKQVEDKGVKVAACCPGWCQTDMSSMRGNKTAAEGADTPVWLALKPTEEYETGLLWGERQKVSF